MNSNVCGFENTAFVGSMKFRQVLWKVDLETGDKQQLILRHKTENSGMWFGFCCNRTHLFVAYASQLLSIDFTTKEVVSVISYPE